MVNNMKKGFTLVEIIGVIIILGLVAILIIPNVTDIIKDTNNLANDNQIATIKEAADLYSINNDLGKYPEEKIITFDTLISSGFLKNDDILKDGERITGCVKYKWLENFNGYEFKYDKDC